MADQYWKYVLGGVTQAKAISIMTLLKSRPEEAQVMFFTSNGTSTATLTFGGGDLTVTKAWVQTNIIIGLGLLTSSSQAIPVGECKTASDIAAGN